MGSACYWNKVKWSEVDHKSNHSARRAMITLTTEKNWSRSTSKSFPPVAQFWSCSEFPRLSWVELGRIGRYDHAKNWTTELWPSFQLLANSSSHRLGISSTTKTITMVARRRKKAAALLGIYLLLKKRRSTKRSCRRKSWVALRDELGAYSNLVRELQVEGTLRNYLRMTTAQFYNILQLLSYMATFVVSLCSRIQGSLQGCARRFSIP